MATADYTIRAATAADLDLLLDLVRSAADSLGLTVSRNREDLTRDLSRHGGHLLVASGGVVQALLLVVPVRGRTVFIEVHARPGTDSTVVDSLIQEGIAKARRIAATDPIAPISGNPYTADPRRWQVGAAPVGGDDQYREALLRTGFRQDRQYLRLHLDLTRTTRVVTPPAPAGLTRRIADTDELLRAAHHVLTTSFHGHHGVVPRTFTQWAKALPDVPGSEIWIGYDGPAAVAVCWCDDSHMDSGNAHIRDIGVLAAARRRGIGRWLMECAIADATRRGLQGVSLSVDSRNPTGALALYDSLGFQKVETVDDWRLPL